MIHTLTEMLIIAVMIAMAMIFINYLTWPGAILDHIVYRGKTISDRMGGAPVWLAYPLWECPMCMAPYYTAGVAFYVYGWAWQLPVMILMAGFFALLLDSIIAKLRE
jgi:hypothetical protein